jgi:arsenate reductase-like glutaredoxin family protein
LLPKPLFQLVKYIQPDLTKAAAKGMTKVPQFYQIKVKVDCDYKSTEDSKTKAKAISDPEDKKIIELESKMVKTPINIDGKVYTGINRKELDDLLIGHNFYGIFKGKMDPFANSQGIYMKLLASEISLKTLPETKPMTEVEKEKFKERGVKTFQELDFTDLAASAEDDDMFSSSTEGRGPVVETAKTD